jgi:hypothetical protein
MTVSHATPGRRRRGGRAPVKRRTAAPDPLIGVWAPDDETDSNVHFTVRRRGQRLTVSAVDVFDGESLRVSKVAQQGRTLRFATTTPSTGSTMEHELRATSATSAVYRFTITQRWKKRP